MNVAEKAPGAFRTIGEVSTDLAIPQHILRFWESKFPQLRPVKRSGNRRYYRREDVALVQRIDGLLNQQGYTIAGVQRLLGRRGGADQIEAGDDTGAGPETVQPDPPSVARFDRAALQAIRDVLVDALERTRTI